MNVMILGGMSPRHKEWVRHVASKLETEFEKVVFLDYRHWTDESEMDLDYEIGEATKLSQNLDEFTIVAKSIGSALATLAINSGLIKPQNCLFLGFPLKVVKKEIKQFPQALTSLPTTIFVQNQQDPLGSAEELRQYLEINPPNDYEIYETPGQSHDYVDFDLIAKLAQNPKIIS